MDIQSIEKIFELRRAKISFGRARLDRGAHGYSKTFAGNFYFETRKNFVRSATFEIGVHGYSKYWEEILWV